MVCLDFVQGLYLLYEPDLNGQGRELVVRKDVYEQGDWNSSNSNAYAGSAVDSWLNGSYKALLSESVQALIGTTKFRYTAAGLTGQVSTLERAVFLLSMTELDKPQDYANVEGTTLPIASALQIAYQDGNPSFQWTRSPYTGTQYDAWSVTNEASVMHEFCITSRGRRPAFALPSDARIDSDGNLIDD